MMRAITILAIIAAISLGLAEIADKPGSVTVEWASYKIETSLLVLITLISFFVLILMFSYYIIFKIFSLPKNFIKSRGHKNQNIGLALLTETFAGIATNDMKLANKKLSQAQKYLPKQPITLMLAAQIARIEGNEDNARKYIEQMLNNEATEFIALRSLIEKSLQDNNESLAIKYAEKAIISKPQDNWLISKIAFLYAKNGRIQDATRILDFSYRKRYINKQFFRNEMAYLAFENAKILFEQRRFDDALNHIKQTIRRLPDFIPASVFMAKIYIAKNDIKAACQIVLSAWKKSPDKDLREILLIALEKYDSKQKYFSLASKIAKTVPEHPESKLLAAEIESWDI
ncbi:MAG: heme biosynthesis HemY N-terminal domain-containing protein [Pseudomonadota bacterium]